MLPQRIRLQYDASVLHKNSVSSLLSFCLITSFPVFSSHFSSSSSLPFPLIIALLKWKQQQPKKKDIDVRVSMCMRVRAAVQLACRTDWVSGVDAFFDPAGQGL